jgi:hypothetical protein
MTTKCKNCHASVNAKFCSHCGQSTDTHPINAHFLWHDIQHGLLHYEKGIPYTAKELFTRPGHSIREYIEGKRIHHFKPISLILILAGVFGFFYHYFHINLVHSFSEATSETDSKLVNFASINEWIGTHYAVVALVKIPFWSLATFWAFRKAGYNYVEHFVLNAFLTSQSLIVKLVFLPLMIVFNATPQLAGISLLSDLIANGFAIWAFWQCFNKMDTSTRFWRIVLAYVLMAALFVVFVILASIFLVIYFKKNHPS